MLYEIGSTILPEKSSDENSGTLWCHQLHGLLESLKIPKLNPGFMRKFTDIFLFHDFQHAMFDDDTGGSTMGIGDSDHTHG